MRVVVRVVVVMTLGLLATGCVSQPSREAQVVAAGGLVFPGSAAEHDVEGYVVVSYDVTIEGTVVNARVLESAPPQIFDDAALHAVNSWRFQPAVEKGEIVAVHGMTSRLDFKLGESEAYVR